ncbi:MAG: GNAT family N-acetyltransferase [Lachnospiraceae bacterium]|nr:GNAT family N-acetyltransferase [Lachnospiraceae bacterium]
MQYQETVLLKNQREALLRNASGSDGEMVYDIFQRTHEETDYLLSYPDENSYTIEEEGAFLQEKADSENEIEILAFVDGVLAGTAGIEAVGTKYKVQHRADFGISVLKEYWGMGIGDALTKACIRCAKDAGFAQLELNVVAENAPAIALYEKHGFREFGRNPKGFRSRISGDQEVIYMRLEL